MKEKVLQKMKYKSLLMNFYSGFSLKNDEHFFEDYIKKSDYTVSGFSYGSIKALEHTKKQISNGKRVDTLQLFSPAFFQTKSDKFKRLQSMSYAKNQEKYLLGFIQGCFHPLDVTPVEHKESSQEELDTLLNFVWNPSELIALAQKGVHIEVYLGGQDKIIDGDGAREFFLNFTTVTYIKNANHFLQIQ